MLIHCCEIHKSYKHEQQTYLHSANDKVSFLALSLSDSDVAVEGVASVFKGVTKGTVDAVEAGKSGDE